MYICCLIATLSPSPTQHKSDIQQASNLLVPSTSHEPFQTFQLKKEKMQETRNIVILGASYAGLGIAHTFLKHVYPHLPTDPNVIYKVVLVDPSSKFYHRCASPRAVASPDLIPIETIMLDIESGFRQYGSKVTFVKGKATTWDDEARTVQIQKANGAIETLSYWSLVLATGTKTYSPFFSLQGSDHQEVADALRAYNEQISTAKSIVISGGGPAGVETAGEIGEALNGTAGWFASHPANPRARITIITNGSKLLPALRQSLSDKAEKVRYSSKYVALNTG